MGGLAIRSKVAFTSSAVSSAPSWNCTPWRRIEGVGLAVLGDLPAMRQIRDDRLAAVARVAPDQIVEHASHGAEIEDGAGLMQIEMRRPHRDAMRITPPGLGLGSGALSLNSEPSNFSGTGAAMAKEGDSP